MLQSEEFRQVRQTIRRLEKFFMPLHVFIKKFSISLSHSPPLLRVRADGFVA